MYLGMKQVYLGLQAGFISDITNDNELRMHENLVALEETWEKVKKWYGNTQDR